MLARYTTPQEIHPITHSDGICDNRYSIRQEYCGYDAPRYVLRFCGEWVAQSISYSSMVMRAVGHKAAMDGAPIITEVQA